MRSALLLLALAGCVDATGLSYPAEIDGRRTGAIALLHVPSESAPGDVRGVVIARADRPVIVPDDPLPNVMLLYDATIEDLGWQTGPVAHAESGRSRLRRPAQVLRRESVSEPWIEVTPEAIGWRSLATFRMEWPDDPCTCFDEIGYCDAKCEPDAPIEPAPPEPWPTAVCPAGMRVTTTTITGEALTSCTSTVVACEGSARATIARECVRVGNACNLDAEGWPVPAPAGPARWVRKHAVGGDGTRAAPWDLTTALASASDGDHLVLAPEFYPTPDLGAQPRLTFSGACPSLTGIGLTGTSTGTRIFENLSLEGFPARAIMHGRIEVRDSVVKHLELDGALSMSRSLALEEGLRSTRGARVTIDDSELRGGSFDVLDSTATLDRIVARDALFTVIGSTMNVRASVITGVHETANIVLKQSVSVLEDVVIGDSPSGVRSEGSTVTIDRVHFSDHVSAAVSADQGNVTMTRVISRGPGRAADLSRGVRARLSHVGGLGVQRDGYFAIVNIAALRGGSPAHVVIEDLRAEGGAHGVDIRGGTLSIRRARIERSYDNGLQAQAISENQDTALIAEDISIRSSRGMGMRLSGSHTFSLDAKIARVEIIDAQIAGLLVWNGEADPIRITDVRVSGVTAGAARDAECTRRSCAGVGISLRPLGGFIRVELERFSVERADDAGLWLGFRAVSESLLRHGRVTSETSALVTDTTDPEWEDQLIEVRLDAPTPWRAMIP